MHFKFTTALSLLIATGTVAAQAGEMATPDPESMMIAPPAATNFGYVGINIGYASSFDTPSSYYDSVSYGVDGAYAIMLGNGSAVVVDALVRFDSVSSDPFYGDSSQGEYQASAHYLRPMGENLTLGGFAGYGYAPFDNTNEIYQLGFIGATVMYDVSSTVALFGQAEYATSFDPNSMSSAGFYNGYAVRAGVIYSGFDFATLRAEAEYAGSEQYEDSDEPGEMWSVAVSGESAVGAAGNLVATYGVRYASIDALTDSNDIAETSARVGIKYMFGGGSVDKFYDIGYVGTPYTPLRASYWTPHMD